MDKESKDSEKDGEAISHYLEFLLLPSSKPWSGTCSTNPCDTNFLSLSSLIPYINNNLLKALFDCGTTVKMEDLLMAVTKLNKDQYMCFQTLISHYQTEDDQPTISPLDLNTLCDAAIISKQLSFLPALIQVGGQPSTTDILNATVMDHLEPELVYYMAQHSDPVERSLLICQALGAGLVEMAKGTLRCGPISPDHINLGDYIVTPSIIRDLDLIRQLLEAGVNPNGLQNREPPLKFLLSSKLPCDQKVQVACALLEGGANVNDLSNVYDDTGGVVHTATKLALETG